MPDALLAPRHPCSRSTDARAASSPATCCGSRSTRTRRVSSASSARFIAAGGDADPAAGRVLYLDGGVLDFGTPLEVSLGPPGTERIVFTGLVSALEVDFEEAGTPDVGVFAEDDADAAAHDAAHTHLPRCSDADIARAIAAEHGLAARRRQPTGRPTTSSSSSTRATSRSCASARGGSAGRALGATPARCTSRRGANRAAPPVTLVQGNDLLSVHAARRPRSSAHDGQRLRLRRRQRGLASTRRAGASAVQAETAGGRTGPQVLARALGEREAACVREAPLTASEARPGRAPRCCAERARSSPSSATTSGTPDLVVGSRS